MNGKTIVAFRATHNLSLGELAELTDNILSSTTISNYEVTNQRPSRAFVYRMERLIDELGIDEKYIGLSSYKKKGYKKGVKTVTPSERPASNHYHTGSIDVWAFADENFSIEEVTGFHRINAIKYLTRYGKKDGYNRKDLEKAIVEIQKLLELHDKYRAEEVNNDLD